LQIGKLHEEKKVTEDLFALACEPDRRVRLYSACIADGVRYHTVDREKNRKTQNSGIVSEGDHDGEEIDFYGQLTSIIKLQYNSSLGVHRSVVLFRCVWFDNGSKKKMGFRDDGYFKSINTAKCWYKNDPFILTTQATKVFYLPDTSLRGDWRVVQRFQHRHLWSVAEDDIEKAPGDGGLSYQDEDDSTAVPVRPNDANVLTRARRGQARVLVDASIVEGMKKRRVEVVGGEENEDGEENETDHTMYQYCSDDEENRTARRVPNFHLDDDDE
jgi:hypothetical protein